MRKISFFCFVSALVLFVPQVSYSAKNLLEGDSSFEMGYGVWNKAGVIDDAVSFDGKHSLKLQGQIMTFARYNLTSGKQYTFSVYLKAEKPDTKILLSAERTNWSGNMTGTWVTVGTEWKRYTLSIKPDPAKWSTIWLAINRDKTGQPEERSYWMDACQFEEGEMSEYEPAEKVITACYIESPIIGNIFYPEEEINIKFNLYNSQKENTIVNLHYNIKDYYGETVSSGVVRIELKPKENNSYSINSLKGLKKKGFYVVKYNLSGVTGMKTDTDKESSFCIVDHPVPYSDKEGSLFGIALALGKEKIPAAERMGAKWVEIVFNWSLIEKEQNKLDENSLAAAEKFIAELKSHNINPLAKISYTPDWAGEYPSARRVALIKQESLPGYENFVYKLVNRFKNKIHYWTHWGGEDDLMVKSFINGTKKTEDYVIERMAEIAKTGYRGAKRADPEGIFGGGGQPSGVDCTSKFPFSRKFFPLVTEYTDTFLLDCYAWPWAIKEGAKAQTPEEHNLDKILKEAVNMAGEEKKYWIAEYGYFLGLKENMDSVFAKKLADYMARSYLLTASVPKIEILQWTCYWNCVEQESSADMLRWPNPLPVTAAYSALAQVLTGAKNPQELQMGSYIKGYSFSKKKGSLVALWVPSDKEIGITIKHSKNIKVIDIMGNELDLKKDKEQITLKLTGSPLYLVSDMPAAELSKIVSEARIDISKPLNVELHLSNYKTVKAYLTNQLNSRQEGTLILNLPMEGVGTKEITSPVIIPTGIMEVKDINLPDKLDIAGLKNNNVTGKIKTNKGEVNISQDLSVIPVTKMSKKVVIDGNLSEWAGREFMELKNTTYLTPPDAFAHGLWTDSGDLSVKGYLGWDNENFYFAAEVSDDIFINENDKEVWNGDSIQIGFDCENDALTTEAPGYKKDDKEFAFGYSQKLKIPVIYQHIPPPAVEPKDTELAIKRAGNYTYYELAIPFNRLSPLRCEEGKIFGFNFIVLDCDYGNKIDYWMGLTPGIGGGKNPAVFKKFILLNK